MVDEKGNFNEEKFIDTIEVAVRFLDNVIDVTKFPMPEIEEMTKKTRKIGLGVMGWHDCLIKMGIAYDQPQAIEWADHIMEILKETALEVSTELGVEKGPFPLWGESIYHEWKHAPRNAERITIAPTGTLSTIANCSSGIEPHYKLAYVRNILDKKFEVKVELLNNQLEQYDITWDQIIANDGRIGKMNVNLKLKRLFKTSLEIAPEDHVKMQAVFQKHTEAAVSKTINLPFEATRDEVAKIIVLAYKCGCKGLTVYRDGSRQEQVLDSRTEWPKERPSILKGQSYKERTGCGSIYVNIASIHNKPYEVMTSMGKAGGCENAMVEALSRVISVSLRYGTPATVIVDQLRGIRCPNSLVGKPAKLSCPDVIGQKMEEEMAGQVSIATPGKKRNTCVCGGEMIYQNGCYECLKCGNSKCHTG